MSAPEPELAATIDQLATEQLVPVQRRRLLSEVARRVPRARLWHPRTAVHWATDTLGEIAPYVSVRDLSTLRHHYQGLHGDALADRLVRHAAAASAGVGAACGGLAAVKWTVPPTLLSAPVLLGAETVAVVVIEMKLVGELHAAYGRPVQGTAGERAVALLRSWAQQRRVDPHAQMLAGAGAGVVLGTATRKQLADRLARRFGRNLPTLAPLLAGAAVGGYLNQRATRALAGRLRTDFRRG